MKQRRKSCHQVFLNVLYGRGVRMQCHPVSFHLSPSEILRLHLLFLTGMEQDQGGDSNTGTCSFQCLLSREMATEQSTLLGKGNLCLRL